MKDMEVYLIVSNKERDDLLNPPDIRHIDILLACLRWGFPSIKSLWHHICQHSDNIMYYL